MSLSKTVVLREQQAQKVAADWGELTWFANRAMGNCDSMTVGRCIIRPGHSNPRHSHPNCSEVLVVLRGTIRHAIEDGAEVEMRAGDTITVPPYLPHCARNTGSEDAVLLVVFDSADRQAKGE